MENTVCVRCGNVPGFPTLGEAVRGYKNCDKCGQEKVYMIPIEMIDEITEKLVNKMVRITDEE